MHKSPINQGSKDAAIYKLDSGSLHREEVSQKMGRRIYSPSDAKNHQEFHIEKSPTNKANSKALLGKERDHFGKASAKVSAHGSVHNISKDTLTYHRAQSMSPYQRKGTSKSRHHESNEYSVKRHHEMMKHSGSINQVRRSEASTIRRNSNE
jgi:hypothetical protein